MVCLTESAKRLRDTIAAAREAYFARLAGYHDRAAGLPLGSPEDPHYVRGYTDRVHFELDNLTTNRSS